MIRTLRTIIGLSFVFAAGYCIGQWRSEGSSKLRERKLLGQWLRGEIGSMP